MPKFTTDFKGVGRAHIMNFGTAVPMASSGAKQAAHQARPR